MAIYIDLESKEIVYEIIETAITKQQQQQHYTTNDNGLMVEEERLFVLEKDLAFAPNCQVRVEGKDATELGVNGLVGSIICSQFTTPYNKSYTIQFTVDGGSRVIGMYNVDPKEVVYVPSKSCIDDDDDDDSGGKNGGRVDTKLQSNVKTGNMLSTGVAQQETDKTNDNVDGNLRKQPSTVQIQQTLLTSASHLPLVSCDSASSSLTSEQQQEAVSLDIRQDASTTTPTIDESSIQNPISVSDTSLLCVSPLAAGACSFHDNQNGTNQVQKKEVSLRWEPPNQVTATDHSVNARFLDTKDNRKRKTLSDMESLSEHSTEHPRKSCKDMGQTNQSISKRKPRQSKKNQMRRREKKSRIPCNRFFGSSGRCPYGDKCHFNHNG
jgi:hypothetical protein